MNDRVVMGVHSRRCARCLVPSPVLGEGRGESMISVTNSGCGARWTSPPARPGRGRTSNARPTTMTRRISPGCRVSANLQTVTVPPTSVLQRNSLIALQVAGCRRGYFPMQNREKMRSSSLAKSYLGSSGTTRVRFRSLMRFPTNIPSGSIRPGEWCFSTFFCLPIATTFGGSLTATAGFWLAYRPGRCDSSFRDSSRMSMERTKQSCGSNGTAHYTHVRSRT